MNAVNRKPARRWARMVSTLAIAAAAVAAIAAAAVVVPHAAMAMSGGHGGPGPMGGPGSPLAGRMLERMLDEVDATDAQRAQIKQIAGAAQADMKAQREAGRALRDQALALLAAPTLDAAAAESLRQQMLAQHDQSSRRMLQAMLDIGNVLTPEQRVKLAEQMKRHQGMMQYRKGPQGEPRG